MSLLSLCAVSFEYSSDCRLFEAVSFSINPSDRLAVVGPNGAGKTTLLQLIAGVLDPVAGTIVRRRPLRIAIADQEVAASVATPLFDFVFEAQPALASLRASILALEQHLDDPAAANDYAARIDEYQQAGGYSAEASVTRILAGLGYSGSTLARDIGTLSGGERTRATLARALATDADLLILDEPTNHLDTSAREWLENELSARPTA